MNEGSSRLSAVNLLVFMTLKLHCINKGKVRKGLASQITARCCASLISSCLLSQRHQALAEQPAVHSSSQARGRGKSLLCQKENNQMKIPSWLEHSFKMHVKFWGEAGTGWRASVWLCEPEVDSPGSEHARGKGEVKEVILTLKELIHRVSSGTFSSWPTGAES